MVSSPPNEADSPAGYPPRRAVMSWALFDWAAQPYFTLINTFIYAPFFAAALAADAVTGQAQWGYATAFAGILIAVLSPLLGGIADRVGPRKPWIVGFGAMLVVGSTALWFAVPGHPASVPLALAGFVIATLGAEFATTFNNAMMHRLVPPERIGWLSGMGWATGYVGGLVSLALTLVFLSADPQTGTTIAGLKPILGLDPALREGDRASGPLTALWFALFIIPMLIFTPDTQRTGIALREAAQGGLSHLKTTLAALPALPDLMRFLIANMVYQDALVALFAFGGIYAAGVFGWGAIQLGLFGILLTITGTAGALIGGTLHDRIGGKRVVLGSILLLTLACLGIAALGKDRVLWLATAPGQGLFGSLPEQLYLGLGMLIGIAAGPLQASSRGLMAVMAPKERVGEFFGLFALAGKVTSFVGPFLVATATLLFDSQQAGLVVLIAMFAAGAAVLATVDTKKN